MARKQLIVEDDDNLADDIRRYDLPGGWVVLAGRTDEANDRLSIKLARPNDWWFHVHGLPGSHVVMQVADLPQPSKDLLEQAASIAAWHSKARNGGLTLVSYTQAKNVRKPRGAKPGTVNIQKEGLLKVRPGLPPGANAGDDDSWN